MLLQSQPNFGDSFSMPEASHSSRMRAKLASDTETHTPQIKQSSWPIIGISRQPRTKISLSSRRQTSLSSLPRRARSDSEFETSGQALGRRSRAAAYRTAFRNNGKSKRDPFEAPPSRMPRLAPRGRHSRQRSRLADAPGGSMRPSLSQGSRKLASRPERATAAKSAVVYGRKASSAAITTGQLSGVAATPMAVRAWGAISAPKMSARSREQPLTAFVVRSKFGATST